MGTLQKPNHTQIKTRIANTWLTFIFYHIREKGRKPCNEDSTENLVAFNGWHFSVNVSVSLNSDITKQMKVPLRNYLAPWRESRQDECPLALYGCGAEILLCKGIALSLDKDDNKHSKSFGLVGNEISSSWNIIVSSDRNRKEEWAIPWSVLHLAC